MAATPLAKRLKRSLRYGAIRMGLWGMALLPVRWASALGGGFGAIAFQLARSERQKAEDSLTRAFPDWPVERRRQTARACFVHLGRCAFELACVDKADV